MLRNVYSFDQKQLTSNKNKINKIFWIPPWTGVRSTEEQRMDTRERWVQATDNRTLSTIRSMQQGERYGVTGKVPMTEGKHEVRGWVIRTRIRRVGTRHPFRNLNKKKGLKSFYVGNLKKGELPSLQDTMHLWIFSKIALIFNKQWRRRLDKLHEKHINRFI